MKCITWIVNEYNIPNVQNELVWEAKMIQTVLQMLESTQNGIVYFKDNQCVPFACTSYEDITRVFRNNESQYQVPRMIFSDFSGKLTITYCGPDVLSDYYYIDKKLITIAKDYDRYIKNGTPLKTSPKQLRESLAELSDALAAEASNSSFQNQNRSH